MRLKHGAGKYYIAANARQQHRCELRPFFVTTTRRLGLASAGAAGTVAAAATTISVGHGWNYHCIKEEHGCCNYK
jgi:hypothetical protein